MTEPLYMKRSILNHEDIHAWAKVQGFTLVVAREELHITMAFITQHVDTTLVQPLQDELLLRFNPLYFRELVRYGGSVSMKIYDNGLKNRNREIHRLVDVPESKTKKYRPHFAISYWEIPDLTHAEPYLGDIHLGPEVIVPLNPRYQVREERLDGHE